MRLYFNMANYDKGRRKWGGNSQDMRSGGNRPPPQALYRPGSGPLRKSGRSDELEAEDDMQSRPKTSVQDRLNKYRLEEDRDVETVTSKLNDVSFNYKSHGNLERVQSTSRNSLTDESMYNRKKHKKPEQPLYVCKKMKEALAERDTSNRSPVYGSNWDKETEKDWDTQSNRSQRNDGYRNYSSNHAGSHNESTSRGHDDRNKRYGGHRRSKNENKDRWRSNSPISSRNYGNRRDNREGSEPLFITPNNSHDSNRMRDSRSVEPYGDKYSGKPPSGKGGMKDYLPKKSKIDNLPPRLYKKYLIDNGLAPPPESAIGTTSEGAWDGSTVTFSGSSIPRYQSSMQHSHTMQNLPPTGPLPPQSNWSNTIPARNRGKGRSRHEDMDSGNVFRPVTPDQYSATSSRSHTPSQDYINRSYDRRGSNSTSYTSMESLNRMDSMPPPATSPPNISGSSRSSISINHQPKSMKSPVNSQGYSQSNRASSVTSAYESKTEESKQETSSNSSVSKSDYNPVIDKETRFTSLDWCEEVELNEQLERMSRSSSIISLRESTSNQLSASNRSKRSKKKKRNSDRRRGDRSANRDRVKETSQERQNNQQNRENDSYNNNQKNLSNSRKPDGRRRTVSHRSREASRERNYRSGTRPADDFFWASRTSDHSTEENWRTRRKPSMCESDDGRRTPHASQINIMPNSSSQPPGVLVLQDSSQLSRTQPQPQPQPQQNQRTLFDPNNPNKPIIVTSSGSRSSISLRDNEIAQSSNVPVFQSQTTHMYSLSSIPDDCEPSTSMGDQFGLTRPAWYEPYSSSFRSAKNPLFILDIERADKELQYILSSGGLMSNWERVTYIRQFFKQSLQILLETDIKFCQAENVEQHFWKILFYNIIEMLRKTMVKDNPEDREAKKQMMLKIIDDGTTYLENLLTVLEKTYEFKLENHLTSTTPPKGLGMLGLALISTQKIFLFLGDLARYKEQANETTNYGKSRQWYLKAQQINPKNGRPYNQLALLAHYARRKLDAVYYYMRSLMASNPFQSARESLITLFDENRKKYESTERKRKEARESKERARMKEKEGATNVGGCLRREIWINPGGRRVRRTTSAALSTDSRLDQSDLEELSQLSSVEVNKRFVTSYLHVHGKLITKIGMETFQEAAIQMLREFRALLQHSPLPLPGTRLLQLLALNMFAIETTQLKDAQMEQGYRSEVQEKALVVSLQMFNLILERGVSLLKSQLEVEEKHRLIVGEDMQILLPAIKIWCDWMLCHSTVWNPPPSCTDYRVGPSGDAWNRLATMVNLLEKLSYPRNLLIPASSVEGQADKVDLVKLPEDTILSGFTPLMSNPQEPFYADKKEDMEVAEVCLRVHKVLFFGQVFLCGLETPVLKLQKSETGVSEYVSIVETSSASSPSSPPEQSDSELLVESYSEDEDEDTKKVTLPDDVAAAAVSPTAASEIRSLIERKEELERRQKRQDRHRQRVQAILQKSSVSVEIEVRPKLLVPDTNCFIDYLSQLQSIAKATSGTQPIYTLMVPLVVLNELEGLAKGADARDCPPSSRAALNPEHVARVAQNAKTALTFARSRNPAIRCVTSKGTVLSSSTFTVEEDVPQDGMTSNDDRILATCLSLCKSNSKDQGSLTEEGQPRRLKREVVLLTEDRNLRVKALARDVPVREVPDFVQWAELG